MYNQDLKRKWDNEAAHVNSIEEGRAKGLAEGLAEGEHKKALEIAAEMKKKNFQDEIIAELTKLTIEEIEKL